MSRKEYSKGAKSDDSAAYEATQSRLSQIQRHFTAVQDGGRLKDKVCILTGVGSVKGIGRASALLFAKEGARQRSHFPACSTFSSDCTGAKALYLLDYNGDGLPDLEKDLQERFPKTKVRLVDRLST